MTALLLGVALALAAVDPHPSYRKLASANGRAVVVFDGDNANGPVLDLFSDHLYQQVQAGQEPTRDLLWDTYFGLGAGDGQGWLTSAASYGYEHGTGILWADRSQGDLAITEYAFAPLGMPIPGFVHLLRVENRGATAEDLRAFSLHNYHLGHDADGDGADDDGEAIWIEDGTLSEWGTATGLGMRIVPLVAPSSFGCDQVWATVGGGASLSGTCGTAEARWEGDDRVGALQWDAALQAGEVAWFGTLEAFFSGWDAGDVRASVEAWRAGRDAGVLLADERAAWATWLAAGVPPAGMGADEQAVYTQQLVFLKMGQVVEEGDAFGQIPASLPLAAGQGGFAHTWNITWVRDSAYAIRALTEAGYLEEAGAALAFLLQDKAGGFQDYLLSPADYPVSVCRCYGDGSEWSDVNEDGPNVELDNWGLLLWALGGWSGAGGDLDLVGDPFRLSQVLERQIEVEGPGQGLVMADSSIWERHWNGQQKHFAYTSTWAAAGLRAAGALWDERGGREHHHEYTPAAERLQRALCTLLRDDAGALAGNLEELDQGAGYDDLAAVEAFNNGTIDAAGEVAAATFARWEERLAVASGHGFKRNDDGDAYDEQEWVFVDLRLAEAYRRACREEDARALEDWITAQAIQNHWTIPELMDPVTGDYNGPAPMLGFGAGAFVLAMHHRAEAARDCADGVAFDCGDEPDDTIAPHDSDPPADSAGGPEDPEAHGGCGCSESARLPTVFFVLLLALVKRRAAA